MAEVELVLRDLPLKIQTASLKERKLVLENVTSVLATEGVTENVVRGICKLLELTLPRYRDSKSQSYVRNTIATLVVYHGDWALKHLTETLGEVAERYKTLTPTSNTSHSGLYALKWSCVLILNATKYCSDNVKLDFQRLIDTQALLLLITVAARNVKKIAKAYKLMCSVWTCCAEMYVHAMSSIQATSHKIVFGAYLIRYLKDTNQAHLIDFKTRLLEDFIKVIFGSKVEPPLYVIQESYPLLTEISRMEFERSILPAMLKGLLRSPEIMLGCIGLVLEGLSLDVGQYAVDIGKKLATHLQSHQDLARDQSAAAFVSLAKKCSDVMALQELLGILFEAYNKLTVAAQKASVLQAAGNMKHSGVPEEQREMLAVFATQYFIPVLNSEVHEKTLLIALEMLSLWCSDFINTVPTILLDCLRNGPKLKTCTCSVRTAYIKCISSCFHGKMLSQSVEFFPFLATSIEKAIAEPAQAPVITEALSAVCFLLRISSDVEIDQQMTAKLNTILDVDKELFVAEKFLTCASEDALSDVLELCEYLFLHKPSVINGKMQKFHRAVIFCLTHTSSRVRQLFLSRVQRLLSSLNDVQLTVCLIKEYDQVLKSAKIINDGLEGKNKNGVETCFGAVINAKVLVECIVTLLSGENKDLQSCKQLALETLVCSHHPVIFSSASNVWFKLLKHTGQDPKMFMHEYAHEINCLVLDNYDASPSLENCLQTIASLNPHGIMTPVINIVKQYLDDPQVLAVTKEEYLIYLTPEDEMLNRSVSSEKQNEHGLKPNNIKQNCKAYEQLEELQSRLLSHDKKKRRPHKDRNLTQKQKEDLECRLSKERAVRSRLSEIYKNICQAVSMVRALMIGNGVQLSCYFSELLPLILKGVQSHLVGPLLSNLFMELRKCVFVGHTGDLVAHKTLEILRGESSSNILHIIRLLHNLTAPAFTYVFPLIQEVLSSSHDKDVILAGVQLISEHAQMREVNETDLCHPRLLPRKQMFELLIDVISNSISSARIRAALALQEVAISGSGRTGCALASPEEIECLLLAVQSECGAVREAALRALITMKNAIPSSEENYELYIQLGKRIWVARCDVSEENRTLALQLWEAAKLEISPFMWELLIGDIKHPVNDIQQAAAQALAELLSEDTSLITGVLNNLLDIYLQNQALVPEKVDEFGHVIEQAIDVWEPRSGVALALTQLAPYLSQKSVSSLVRFFVSTGLGDRNAHVRKNMLATALAVLNIHGRETVDDLLPLFEEFLDKAPDCASLDPTRQAVVLLMGSLARHLNKEDPRIMPIVHKLLEALSTPSQQVQEAVAMSLPPLVPAIRDTAPYLVQNLLKQLLESENYGDRKGAAYGLASLVKGMGILTLKQLDIMTTLMNAIQNKKNQRHREGALFAFEMLCNTLGRLFEPYIVHILPHLLVCLGDGNQYVRDAADETSRVVMSRLSSHGVKLVLPSLLAALEEDSWRTKTGSIELLGAMAFCAPKQLSSCLPSIVPKLIEVLSDSHVKVQKAGAQALKQIGSVIRNPEIQLLVPTLLEALQDPSHRTATSLQTLLDTQFVHVIDAPSLALIMPVVQRAFMDRCTETRKMAAQIIGNMYSLTDQRDLTPYLPTIIPGLKSSLLDPVPEVRSVSARALGAMVRAMGESSFEDLLPWLMVTLTSESSSVDRSGAAQGLSEVVSGLGADKFHKIMPEIISTAERTDIAPHVKDGYIMMFIYMPAAFPIEFTQYICQIINPILKALADENEYVRDTALKAGQRIVNLYADTAITLLLPELEKGLFDENWRIRYSSVQLLGDLLYRISGVSGKMSTQTADEDDNFGTEQSHRAILDILGAERRNRVLAGLYMGRSDLALMVRQAALHVWKVVVTNTPRTLREILPTLITLLLSCLASASYDKRHVAARTLGDLVKKLGERVLPEIIPFLEDGLKSPQVDQRQGVCIGLSEIMGATNREMVLTFVNSLVPTVRKALCDPLPEVRQAAAKTFDHLHTTVGVRVLDDILPGMLKSLNDPDPRVSEPALDGLRQVMALKSRVVLPYLVPQLIGQTHISTKALSVLASEAGEALTRYLDKILPALLTAVYNSKGSPQEVQELDHCQAVVLSILDEAGVQALVDHLLESSRRGCVGMRLASLTLLCTFCKFTRADYSQCVPRLFRGLIPLFTDSCPEVLLVTWECLSAVTKTLDPSQLSSHVLTVRQAISFAASDLKDGALLPGFCLPKGITPILPIFRDSILNGLPELKEQATQALGEVILLTSSEALQPSVVHITGPLIRILGDRFNASVKIAVLETLALLLAKVGVMLKQFLPQLQTTFLKALVDSNRQVRIKAASALGHLIVIHTRADSLFMEVLSGLRSAEDPAFRDTMLHALRVVITTAGDKMTEAVRKSVHSTLISLLVLPDDTGRAAAAGCLGALCRHLCAQQLQTTLNDHLLCDDSSQDGILRHGRSTALYVALKEAAPILYTTEYKEQIHSIILGYLAADRVLILMNGVRACTYLFQHVMLSNVCVPQLLMGPFVKTMNNNNNQVKILVARSCSFLAKTVPPQQMATDVLRPLIPMLVNGTKEKNTFVKANSESALVSVLRLRHGRDMQQRCLDMLDVGAREALADVICKVANQQEGKDQDLDETLLT
ncbi:stalled ribosome sensor GCN1-like [Anabrus simplex]|uniref:stalled ribosome sensor GCN1-like n=1 Tax=Anabrus simplex TaxID=316456 RepID=UPI0035A2F195